MLSLLPDLLLANIASRLCINKKNFVYHIATQMVPLESA